MSMPRNFILYIGLVVTVMLFQAWVLAGEVLVVTANTSTTTISDLPVEDLKSLYLGRKNYLHGQPIQITDNGPLMNEFYLKVTKKEMTTINQIWGVLVYTGKMDRPKVLKNDDEVISYVKNNFNAVGYVTTLPSTESSVRVIAILK